MEEVADFGEQGGVAGGDRGGCGRGGGQGGWGGGEGFALGEDGVAELDGADDADEVAFGGGAGAGLSGGFDADALQAAPAHEGVVVQADVGDAVERDGALFAEVDAGFDFEGAFGEGGGESVEGAGGVAEAEEEPEGDEWEADDGDEQDEGDEPADVALDAGVEFGLEEGASGG